MTAGLAYLAGAATVVVIEAVIIAVAVRAGRSRRPSTRPDRIFTLDVDDAAGAWTPPSTRTEQ